MLILARDAAPPGQLPRKGSKVYAPGTVYVATTCTTLEIALAFARAKGLSPCLNKQSGGRKGGEIELKSLARKVKVADLHLAGVLRFHVLYDGDCTVSIDFSRVKGTKLAVKQFLVLNN